MSIFKELFDTVIFGVKVYVAVILCFIVLPVSALVIFSLYSSGQLWSSVIGKLLIFVIVTIVGSILYGVILGIVQFKQEERLKKAKAKIEEERSKVCYIIIK